MIFLVKIRSFKYIGIGTEYGNLKKMESLFGTQEKFDNVEVLQLSPVEPSISF